MRTYIIKDSVNGEIKGLMIELDKGEFGNGKKKKLRDYIYTRLCHCVPFIVKVYVKMIMDDYEKEES